MVTEDVLVSLPKLVQRYLRFAGVIGKPRVQNFWMKMQGFMSPKIHGPLFPINAEQYEFFDSPSRFFYITMNMYGIPAEALHEYSGPFARFRVKVAKLIPVVNASGPKMDQSETVTLFNDMCLLAPATLIDTHIQWKVLDDRSIEATFTNAGHTISAVLYFGKHGEIVNFTSKDRYLSADGKKYFNYVWSTPVSDYRTFDGITIASKGEAIWETESGSFSYIQSTITDVQYNIAQPVLNAP